MKTYTYSKARQKLSEVLETAREEDVLITRRGGDVYRVTYTRPTKSPFDVPGVRTQATTRDIIKAVRESRERERRLR